MDIEALLQHCCGKKITICVVGAGGKTSLISWLADEFTKRGRKVLVTTTTHIRKPGFHYADTEESVLREWGSGGFAVVGTPVEEHKLAAPDPELYNRAAAKADVVLIEADGSKRLPCKVPAPYEPVITEDCNLVIGVMGMTAIGKPLKDICFRFETQGRWLGRNGEDLLTEEIAAEILGNKTGTRKGIQGREYIVVLNQCDNDELLNKAQNIKDMLGRDNIPAICMELRKCENYLE